MKIGVVCDNYKVESYVKEFHALDIICVPVPLTPNTTTLFIYVSDKDAVENIVNKLEKQFKDLKPKK